jgi:RNA polymerase sigma-70 factor, ECF subfamily
MLPSTMTSLDRTLLQDHRAPPTTENLVRDYYSYIRRLALSILNDADEADDAAQETFIAAHRALEYYRGEAAPKTWLTSIAVNACRGRLRKQKIRQGMLDTLQGLHILRERAVSPEAATLQRDADHRLWAAVDSLGEKHRIPVILHYVHELTIPEIAAALGTNIGTVYSRLHYARQQLLTTLEGYDHD